MRTWSKVEGVGIGPRPIYGVTFALAGILYVTGIKLWFYFKELEDSGEVADNRVWAVRLFVGLSLWALSVFVFLLVHPKRRLWLFTRRDEWDPETQGPRKRSAQSNEDLPSNQ